MHICYNENEPRNFSGGVNIYAMNPHKPYRRHLENKFYLQFISRTTDRLTEKQQAEKELIICQRKLDYWRKHPNFDSKEEERMMQDLKKTWNVP